MMRFFMLGYGLAAGAGISLWLGGAGGFLTGALVTWLGGSALSLVLAWGWWRGLWMQGFQPVTVAEAEARLVLEPATGPRSQDQAELARWDADLSAELFGVDLSAEEAARAAAEEANPDKKTA